MLERITAPLVLPQRLVDALDSVVEALAGLPAFEQAVLEHLEAAGTRLDTANARLDHANERLYTAATDLAAVRESAGDLAGTGPLAKARDAIAGSEG